MMYPILCKIKFETLHHVFSSRTIWIQIAFSLLVNWIIAPLVMVLFTSYNKVQYLADIITS